MEYASSNGMNQTFQGCAERGVNSRCARELTRALIRMVAMALRTLPGSVSGGPFGHTPYRPLNGMVRASCRSGLHQQTRREACAAARTTQAFARRMASKTTTAGGESYFRRRLRQPWRARDLYQYICIPGTNYICIYIIYSIYNIHCEENKPLYVVHLSNA